MKCKEQQYYFWIDAQGNPVSPAFSYDIEEELSAEQETPPFGAYALRTGSKSQLMSQYGLSDEAFENE